MAFRVILEATAEQDALECASYILAENKEPSDAARWLSGLEQAVESLGEFPLRFRVIDEQASFDIELRQFVSLSHRVIYHVSEDHHLVHVLQIYHSARSALRKADLGAASEL